MNVNFYKLTTLSKSEHLCTYFSSRNYVSLAIKLYLKWIFIYLVGWNSNIFHTENKNTNVYKLLDQKNSTGCLNFSELRWTLLYVKSAL